MSEQRMIDRDEKNAMRMKEANVKGSGTKSMREISAHVTRHHLEPLPEAQPPEINPFPAPVIRALVLGMFGGLLVGLAWGMLLFNNVVTVPGWEALYSMTPFTFLVFWSMIGAAFGGLVVGVAGILTTPGVILEKEKEKRKEAPQETED